MKLVSAQCPACHASLEIPDGASKLFCMYCGNQIVITHEAGPESDFVVEGGVLRKYKGNAAHIVVPDGVKEIGPGAFKNVYADSVTLPEGLQYIGDEAFMYAHISSIALPEGLTGIGQEAFGFSSLTKVSFPTTLLIIGDSAFRSTGVAEAVLPAGLKEIGSNAFRDTRVQRVVMPEGLEWVGADIFTSEFVFENGFDSVEFPGPAAPNRFVQPHHIFKGAVVRDLKVADTSDLDDLYYSFDRTSPGFARYADEIQRIEERMEREKREKEEALRRHERETWERNGWCPNCGSNKSRKKLFGGKVCTECGQEYK